MNVNQTAGKADLETILNGALKTQSSSSADLETESLSEELANTLEYLDSEDAVRSMQTDPYWPKWHSPWWHMTLLYEMGLSRRVPASALELFVTGMNRYLHFFPFSEQEVPEDRDPLNDVLCLCALATAHRVLTDAGVDVQERLPWLRDWFTKYQLPDGGYNCDESSYIKEGGKSSMISTVHMLESWLVMLDEKSCTFTNSQQATRHPLSDEELNALDRSAQYILERRLMRSLSKRDQIMDPAWIELTFPRFYEIDILRTLRVVLQWALLRQKQIEWNDIKEVAQLLHQKMNDGTMKVERQFYINNTTRIPAKPEYLRKQPVTSFALLERVGRLNQPSVYLDASWKNAMADLRSLKDGGLLIE